MFNQHQHSSKNCRKSVNYVNLKIQWLIRCRKSRKDRQCNGQEKQGQNDNTG